MEYDRLGFAHYFTWHKWIPKFVTLPIHVIYFEDVIRKLLWNKHFLNRNNIFGNHLAINEYYIYQKLSVLLKNHSWNSVFIGGSGQNGQTPIKAWSVQDISIFFFASPSSFDLHDLVFHTDGQIYRRTNGHNYIDSWGLSRLSCAQEISSWRKVIIPFYLTSRGYKKFFLSTISNGNSDGDFSLLSKPKYGYSIYWNYCKWWAQL